MMSIASASMLADANPLDIALACLGLMAVVIAGWVAVTWLRKRIWSEEEDGDAGGFTLEDLRRLRDTGRITAAEFQKARDQVTSAIKRNTLAGQKSANKPLGESRPESGPTRKPQ